jgi:hypothetical protein
MKTKPYTLVDVEVADPFVEQGRRHFVGQVMSFPYLEGLTEVVKVRRVPGHPGTLIDVPLRDLSPARGRSKKFVHYAEVRGVGTFPSDMLRYDSCVPVNFEVVEDEYGRVRAVPDEEGAPLLVADVTDSATPSWTTERWRSFLWTVTPLRTERVEGGTL